LIDYYTSDQIELAHYFDKNAKNSKGSYKLNRRFFELAYHHVGHDLSTNQTTKRTFNVYPNIDSPNKVINAFECDLNDEPEAKPFSSVIEVYHCKFCESSNDIREEIEDHYYHTHANHLNELEGSYQSRNIDLLITNEEESYVNISLVNIINKNNCTRGGDFS
jgi:hypothetical protein